MKIYHYVAHVAEGRAGVFPVKDAAHFETVREMPSTVTISGDDASVVIHLNRHVGMDMARELIGLSELVKSTYCEEVEHDAAIQD